MFEWICPQCNRLVLPELKECPHCAELAAQAAAAPAPAGTEAGAAGQSAEGPGAGQRRLVRVVRRPRVSWAAVRADIERGFRFGLGLLAALAVGYFVLFFAAYVWAHPETFERISRWFRLTP